MSAMDGLNLFCELIAERQAQVEPQTCAMCRFWLEQEVEAECPRRGDCRRCPPAPDPDSSFAAFPVTMHDCWCGEWQAK